MNYEKMKKAELIQELQKLRSQQEKHQEGHDVHEHLLEELQSIKVRFYAMIQQSADAILVLDKKGIVHYVNPAAEALFDRKANELIGQPFGFPLIHGERTEIDVIQKGGKRIIAEMHVAQIQEGKRIAHLASLRDITDRKHGEEALRESEANFRNIITKSADAIIIAGRDGIMHFANPAAESLFHRKAEELEGELFGFPVVTGERTEIDVIRRGGETAVAEMRITETEWEGKQVYLASLRDMTERKRAEEVSRKFEAQKMVVERLTELDQIKNAFVSTVTHELRTPMTPMKSVLTMFLDGSLGVVTPKQKKYLEMMARNIDRLVGFTTDVLSLSRVESGKYNLKPRHMSVLTAVKPAIELLERKAREGKSSISVDMRTEVMVFADPDAVGQVLSNLLANAIAHTPEGTAINISIKQLDDNFVEASVADNGQGIPEEALEKIFERFYQVDREDGPGYRGTGLGLPLCKALVETMGGQLTVESKVGEGTTFKFTLPTMKPNGRECSA